MSVKKEDEEKKSEQSKNQIIVSHHSFRWTKNNKLMEINMLEFDDVMVLNMRVSKLQIDH